MLYSASSRLRIEPGGTNSALKKGNPHAF